MKVDVDQPEETSKLKVLLVEDQAIVALMEMRELEEYGYSAVLATSGEEAWDHIRSDPSISVVLMDVDLGVGMDGTETAQKILKFREIPVLFLSSYTNREIVRRTEEVTSYGYIVKNSGITVIDASIKMALRLFRERQHVSSQRRVLERKNQETRILLEEVVAAKKEVLLSREVQQTLIDFSPMPVIGLDINGNVTIWNDAAENALGWTYEEVKGNLLPSTDPEIDKAYNEMLGQVLQGESVRNIRLVRRRKDGLPIDLRVSGSAIRSVSGEIIGALAILSGVRLKLIE